MRVCKIILIFGFLIICLLAMTSCGRSFGAIPRVDMIYSNYRFDELHIPLRKDYMFAEVPYGIVETDDGYDIVIHCVKSEE